MRYNFYKTTTFILAKHEVEKYQVMSHDPDCFEKSYDYFLI